MRLGIGKQHVALWVSMVALFLAPARARASDFVPDGVKPACPHVDGFVDGPFVATPEAAKQMFLVARRTILPHKPAPPLKVEAEGDHWSVIENPPERKTTVKPRKGETDIVVNAGGGQLYMNIDMCTGAISGVAFNR